MAEHRLRFPPEVTALAAVRRFAAQAADDLDSGVDRDDLAVVVGELAANAAIHQDGEVEVAISAMDGGGLEVEVIDRDRTHLEVIDGPAWDVEGHRGLFLVEALSAAWGVEVGEDGKRVWAQLAPAGDAAASPDAAGTATEAPGKPTADARHP